jgi:hypothetical protein
MSPDVEPMRPEEFIALVETFIAPFTAMLAVSVGAEPLAGDIVDNGTGALVAIGRDGFLVTNYHVYESFRWRREADPEARLLMSGAHGTRFLDISRAEVCGSDRDRDLAVLRVPPPLVLRQGKMFMSLTPWPPRRPEAGMLAVVYGYPGEGRLPQGGSLGVRGLSVALPVVSVSDRHFVLSDENGDAARLTPDGANPFTRFGGISGAAVYVMTRETATTRAGLYLGGFVYEASDTGIICVVHADFINADGTIR